MEGEPSAGEAHRRPAEREALGVALAAPLVQQVRRQLVERGELGDGRVDRHAPVVAGLEVVHEVNEEARLAEHAAHASWREREASRGSESVANQKESEGNGRRADAQSQWGRGASSLGPEGGARRRTRGRVLRCQPTRDGARTARRGRRPNRW